MVLPQPAREELDNLIVWTEPQERFNMRLQPGDIAKAIEWYRQKTGEEPTTLVLHSSNLHLAVEVPDGIEVLFRGGCLGSEVWLGPCDDVTARGGRIKQFDIQRDLAIIEAGGFFCKSCSVAKPAEEQSADPRYCKECNEFLLKEATMDTGWRGSKWKPQTPHQKLAHKKHQGMESVGQGIMRTVNDKKTRVRIIQPPVRKVTREKRGPKHKPLPVELITQWAGEGMGTKAIASRLKRECQITIHHSTIQRILSGQRELL